MKSWLFIVIFLFAAVVDAYTVVDFNTCVKICQQNGNSGSQCQTVCRWPDIILKTERAANDACGYAGIDSDHECEQYASNQPLPQNFGFFRRKKRRHSEIRVAEGSHVAIQAVGEITMPFSGLAGQISAPRGGDGPCQCSSPVQPVAFEFGTMDGRSKTEITGSLCPDQGCITKAQIPPPANLRYNYPIKITYSNPDCKKRKTGIQAIFGGRLCNDKQYTISLRKYSNPSYTGDVLHGDKVHVYSNSKAVSLFNLVTGKTSQKKRQSIFGLFSVALPPPVDICFPARGQDGTPMSQRGSMRFGKLSKGASRALFGFLKNSCENELNVKYEMLDPVSELLGDIDIAAF